MSPFDGTIWLLDALKSPGPTYGPDNWETSVKNSQIPHPPLKLGKSSGKWQNQCYSNLFLTKLKFKSSMKSDNRSPEVFVLCLNLSYFFLSQSHRLWASALNFSQFLKILGYKYELNPWWWNFMEIVFLVERKNWGTLENVKRIL